MDISSLLAKKCQSCNADTIKLTDDEITNYLQILPDWQFKDGKLERQIKLKDFNQALSCANGVGAIAEAENHHPDLLVSWGLLKINIFTHAVNGLTENDFILAAKINRIFC